jgi:hypothetical protein
MAFYRYQSIKTPDYTGQQCFSVALGYGYAWFTQTSLTR